MRHKTISARRIRSTCVGVVTVCVGSVATAQDSARASLPIVVGSEGENYLRYLQSLGDVPLHPWSMRGFSDTDLREMRRGSAADVCGAWPVASPVRRAGFGGVQVLPATGTVIYNTLIPYGLNDGALWAGRGLSLELRGGVTAKWGPLRRRRDRGPAESRR